MAATDDLARNRRAGGDVELDEEGGGSRREPDRPAIDGRAPRVEGARAEIGVDGEVARDENTIAGDTAYEASVILRGAGSLGNTVTNIQGVAFNASIYMGNTTKGDGALFGIPQATQTVGQTIDQNYIANVYRGVAAVPNQRIVGTSWGSQPNTEQYQTLLPTTGTSTLPGRASTPP